MTTSSILPITTLPKNLPIDGAIAITLQDGVMIFRASQKIQQSIENLLDKRAETPLTENHHYQKTGLAKKKMKHGRICRMKPLTIEI
jgi:hypothetical protein